MFHNERDVCIGLVSHCLSIRARPSTRRMSQRSSRHGESFAHTFTGSHECMRAQATGTTSAAAVWQCRTLRCCHQGGKHCLLEPLPTPSGGRGSLRPVNSNPQRQHQRQGRLGALIPARPCVPPLALPSCAPNTLTCVALAMRRRSCTDRHRHHRRHRQRRFRRHHCRRAASRRRTAAAPTALSAPRPCAAPGTRQRQCLRQPDGRECWVLC